jgi:energy-coupling factor transport system substrate-specific component
MTTVRKSGLKGWNTRDLLVSAVIGIVFGLIAVPIQWAFTSLEMLTGPIGSRILIGIFYTPAFMAIYIIRRPGAAFIATLISALVQAPLNPYGWAVLAMAFTNGVPIELAFLVTRYRRYGLPMLLISAAAVGVFGFLGHAANFGYFNLAPVVLIASVVVQIISSALLGGWLAKALSDAVAKTGVLNSFAVGQTQQEEV